MQETSCLERFFGTGENFPWDLADAFDAACNGLENPEALARMEKLPGRELKNWKQLVYAVRAMYQSDEEACRRAADAIEGTSPPGSLKGLFSAWLAGVKNREAGEMPDLETRGDSGAPCQELYRKLLVHPHPLRIIAEQADEALRQGMTGHFERLSQSVLRGLLEERRCDGRLLALRYARYCLSLLKEEGYTQTDFFSLVIRVLGRADGFFVIGLSLLDDDENAALQSFEAALETRKEAVSAEDRRGSGGNIPKQGLFLDNEMAAALQAMTGLIREEHSGAAARRKDPGPKAAKPSGVFQLELF
jgi:hypothetical protein